MNRLIKLSAVEPVGSLEAKCARLKLLSAAILLPTIRLVRVVLVPWSDDGLYPARDAIVINRPCRRTRNHCLTSIRQENRYAMYQK